MAQFIKDLHSPYWWLGVILVGVVVNLFSGWLKDAIDTALRRLFKKIADRTPKSAADREARIARLASSPTYLILAGSIDLGQRIEAVLSILGAILMFLVGLTFVGEGNNWPIGCFAFASVFIIFAMIEILRARRVRSEIDEAVRRGLETEQRRENAPVAGRRR